MSAWGAVTPSLMRLLSAAKIRRLTWCLVVERRATFFETTTAYPVIDSGETARKCLEETLRLLVGRVGKEVRAIRSRRGNTFGYAERRVRPARRRPRTILRPALVLERTRNPCALARLRFLG